MRLSTKIIITLFVLAVLALFQPVYRNYYLNRPIDVYIADQHFRVPYKYFDMALKNSTQHDVMLLEVSFPDMAAKADIGDKEDYRRVWQDEMRIGWILVESAAAKTSFSELLNRRQRNSKESHVLESVYGLERHRITQYDPEMNSMVEKNDYYLHKNELGEIDEVVQCNSDDAGSRARCDHLFRWNGLSFRISYNKKNFLSDWRGQRDRALALLDQFRVKPATEGEQP